MKNKRYIREQRALCGDNYMEVDYLYITEKEHKASLREKKRKASSEAQKARNAAHASRYFVQLVNTNFSEEGYAISLTYDDSTLPETPEEAFRDLRNYVRRLQSFCKRREWAVPKWIAVTEWREEDKSAGVKAVRFHHHMIVQVDGLNQVQQWELRDRIEHLWTKDGEALGYINADKLQPENDNLEALAKYMTKYTNRKHRWRASRNLKKPVYPRPNDSKMSARRLHEACTQRIDDREYWESRFAGYRFTGAEAVFDEEKAEWRLLVKLRRKRNTKAKAAAIVSALAEKWKM